MKTIEFAKGHPFPPDAVTQKFAFLGQSGSGKTYGAGKFVEGLLQLGAQVVILDRVGTWYGLRTGQTDQKAGFPIPVVGGAQGDLPLVPTGGSLVADVIVDQGCSMVLDVNEFRKNERAKFVTDFVEQLFQRKKSARTPLHIVIEEAQAYCPQRTFRGEERMLGAFEDLCKLGRNYGIGYTLISQRPQALHKDILNQTGTLMVFRMTGPQERKVMEGWINEQGGIHKEMVQELPSLETGMAYLWSPQWLDCYRKVRILKKLTLDASSTPTLQQKSKKSEVMRSIDLSTLKQAMEQTVSEAEAKDPAKLKKTISLLEARVRKLEGEKARLEKASVKSTGKVIESPQPTLPKNLMTACTNLFTVSDKLRDILTQAQKSGVVVPLSPVGSPEKISQLSRPVPPQSGSGKTRILTVLAQYPEGKVLKTLATLAGYTVNGHFQNMLRDLKNNQYVIGGQGQAFTITEQGQAALGDYEPLPIGEDLRQYWLGKISGGEGKILAALFNVFPEWLLIADLAEQSGYTVNGHFQNMVRHLATMDLIVRRSGEAKAAHSLFEE